jgi:hypothetical protein
MVRDVVVSKIPTPARQALRRRYTVAQFSPDELVEQFRDTLHVRYTKDGVTGYGEGAPIVRYHENAVDDPWTEEYVPNQ